MKRCPECKRDYYDDSLSYCLDDGAALLDGPGNAGERPTKIIGAGSRSEAPTRPQFGARVPDRRPETPGEAAERRRSSVRMVVASLGVLLVVAAVGFVAYRYLAFNAGQIESIAVMPFTNQSGDPDVEFLCDGMTEALISSLSRVPTVSVKARNSVFRYKGREVATRDVARDLGVKSVLLGWITTAADHVSLRLELVDPSTESVIWSELYERKRSDLVSLQSDIARDVSKKLHDKLSGTEIARIERRPTTNSEAYQLYLRGRFEWNKRQKEPLLRAVDYFKQAIALDPAFGLAHVGLADCYIVFNTYEVAPPSEAYPLARAAVQKALELDPEMADAHAALAAINEDFDWDFTAAERNYRRSIELAPNNASTHQWLGEFLRMLGNFDEAIAEGKRSVELDPVSLAANNSFGLTYFYGKRFDEAIAQQKKTIELDPTYPWPYARMADCYALKGMYNEASAQYRKAIELSNNGAGASWVLAHYGYSLGRSGNLAEARKVERQLRERQKIEFIEGDNLAILYYGLGDIDATFAELERGYKERSPGIRYIKVDPRYGDDLRSDPRYAVLLKKIGVPL